MEFDAGIQPDGGIELCRALEDWGLSATLLSEDGTTRAVTLDEVLAHERADLMLSRAQG